MPETTNDEIARLMNLANQVRGMFKDDATEPERMRAAGALVEIVLTVVIDLKQHTHAIERLADTVTPEVLAHLLLSVDKLADATEVLAELERRRGPH